MGALDVAIVLNQRKFTTIVTIGIRLTLIRSADLVTNFVALRFRSYTPRLRLIGGS